MHLLLTATVLKRLRRELRRARSQEIGGLLMGEHVRDDVFRIVDMSVQRSGGSVDCFVRDPTEHQATLQAFFARTGGDYTSFNYLGEWHSHPAFEPVPSAVDVATMQSIVEDPSVGVNFLVLVVVKRAGRKKVEGSATMFRPNVLPASVGIVSEETEAGARGVPGLCRYLRDWWSSGADEIVSREDRRCSQVESATRGRQAMKKRFEGEDGRRVLVDLLRDQKMVGGNAALAEEIATVGELREVERDTLLIDQNGEDTDCFLILSGTFTILVNGKKVATRGPTEHVGEMAAIQPSQPRSATVVAAQLAVVLKVTEPQLSALAQKYPNIYRAFAKELARRLMQRNMLMTALRESIRVFIISSVEALPIARAAQNAFDHDPFTVVIWTDGVFRASHYPVESLERELDQSDFAIAIAQPDDMTESRREAKPTPRDNVIFELGFFMGRLGRHRSLLLEPRDEEVQLPSDLTGITAIPYKYDLQDPSAAMGPACNRVRDIINECGPNN